MSGFVEIANYQLPTSVLAAGLVAADIKHVSIRQVGSCNQNALSWIDGMAKHGFVGVGLNWSANVSGRWQWMDG